MITTTPEGFAKKLVKAAHAVKEQDKLAITARANVTKKIITETAANSSKLGRRFGRRFVKQDILGRDTAQLRLKGGFAFLAELGSYKASSSGWDEEPKPGFQALNTPYGFFAKVDHPPIAAHPFWQAGLEASRKPGADAWAKTMRDSIAKAIR